MYRLLVDVLSPASYSIYLLHQPVFEWYSVATTGKWWTRRKPGFEWFSPDPIDLDWWEALIVICLAVVFSLVVTHIANTLLMGRWLAFIRVLTFRRNTNSEAESSEAMVLAAMEDLVGITVTLDDVLQDTGLASLGVAALASVLNNKKHGLALKAGDLATCLTVRDVVFAMEAAQTLRGAGEDAGVAAVKDEKERNC